MGNMVPTAQNFTPITQQTNTGNANQNYLQATNDSSVVPQNMFNDYQNFWHNTPVGGSVDFAGGKLVRSDTHGASQGEQTGMWTGANGQQASMTANSNLTNLANNNPAIAQQWKAQYGFNPSAGTSANLPPVDQNQAPQVPTQPTQTQAPIPDSTPMNQGQMNSGAISQNVNNSVPQNQKLASILGSNGYGSTFQNNNNAPSPYQMPTTTMGGRTDFSQPNRAQVGGGLYGNQRANSQWKS